MARPRRKSPLTLVRYLERLHPEISTPRALIASGHVRIDGNVSTNPASQVKPGASVAIVPPRPLAGEAKLRFALARFGVGAEGRVALDLGAAAGGFTRVLLEHGARRVYAVDAGFGQLRGSLRADPRVVNLERVNLADLDRRLVPEPVGLVTCDLSYLAIADAAGQLDGVALAAEADLVALVKPMYELGLARPPDDARTLEAAVAHAAGGLVAAGWSVRASARSPVRGGRGAIEGLLHARR